MGHEHGKWNRGYNYAQTYCTRGGSIPIPQTYVTGDGYSPDEWMHSQECRFRRSALESDKVKRLAAIGMAFGR